MGNVTKFWMVQGIGQGPAKHRHATRKQAAAEARRLARATPGVTYVVLESIEAVTLREFDTIDFRATVNTPDDYPF